jgi:hypothetical protein
MASADQDYSALLLQSRDLHPLKKYLSLYTRRRLRRAISIARNPRPLFVRKLAARKLLPALSPDLRVEDRKGYIFLPDNFIQNIDPVIEMAYRAWDKYRERMAATDKYFLKFQSYVPAQDISSAVHIALQKNVLKLTSDYIGGVPVLKDLEIWWTRPSQARVGAQNFHLDSIPDTHSLRFFVALTDVDSDNGPLTFYPADRTEEIVKEMGYLGGAIDAGLLQRRCGDAIVATCKRGSAIALDTARCVHMGSTNMKKDRLMLSISFASIYMNEPLPSQERWLSANPDLDAINKLVLNL